MPRAPIRIHPARPPILESDWQVAYVRARLEADVHPADALRRYRPEAYIEAQEIARERGISPSQQLRGAVRAADQAVSRILVTEARRRGLYGTARGLRMLPRLGAGFETVDLGEVIEVSKPARQGAGIHGYKSVEELRDELPDWSEQEILDHWQAEYEPLLAKARPAAASRRSRPSRRERVIRLTRECLTRLLTPIRPQPDDHLQAWLPASLANRLRDNGILTIHDLMVRVSREAWTQGLAGFGATKAKLVESWLREQSMMPSRQRRSPPRRGPALPSSSGAIEAAAAPHDGPAAAAVDPISEAIAPLVHAPALNGQHGRHRTSRSMLRARTDIEAIQAWLETLRSPNTLRAYRKEALRFMLWSTLARGQAVSSLDVEDALAYLRFLRDIPHDWRCEPQERTTPQLSIGWRPFDRPQLSQRSIAYAATVLHRMYQWLGKVRYLAGNPFGGLSKASFHPERTQPQQRHLPKHLTDRVLALLDGPDGDEAARVRSRRRLLCALLFDTGLRRHEAAALTFDRVTYVPDPRLDTGRTTRFELRVTGKGNKERSIPISPRLLRLLQEELTARGLPANFGDKALAGVPVIGRLRDPDAGCLSPESIYLECKAALSDASRCLRDAGDLHDAALLEQATTHWTRHSFGMAIVETAGLAVVQELLGHEDLNTTRTYARISATTRAAALADAGIGIDGGRP